jgi:hypothetical protein
LVEKFSKVLNMQSTKLEDLFDVLRAVEPIEESYSFVLYVLFNALLAAGATPPENFETIGKAVLRNVAEKIKKPEDRLAGIVRRAVLAYLRTDCGPQVLLNYPAINRIVARECGVTYEALNKAMKYSLKKVWESHKGIPGGTFVDAFYYTFVQQHWTPDPGFYDPLLTSLDLLAVIGSVRVSSWMNPAFSKVSEHENPEIEPTTGDCQGLRAATETQPSAVVKDQPSAVVKDQPSAVVKDQPSAVVKDQPSAAVKDQPSAVFKDQPSAVVKDQPSAVFKDQPSASSQSRTGVSTRVPSPVSTKPRPPLAPSAKVVLTAFNRVPMRNPFRYSRNYNLPVSLNPDQKYTHYLVPTTVLIQPWDRLELLYQADHIVEQMATSKAYVSTLPVMGLVHLLSFNFSCNLLVGERKIRFHLIDTRGPKPLKVRD